MEVLHAGNIELGAVGLMHLSSPFVKRIAKFGEPCHVIARCFRASTRMLSTRRLERKPSTIQFPPPWLPDHRRRVPLSLSPLISVPYQASLEPPPRRALLHAPPNDPVHSPRLLPSRMRRKMASNPSPQPRDKSSVMTLARKRHWTERPSSTSPARSQTRTRPLNSEWRRQPAIANTPTSWAARC
jgi:hypothetical protein